MGVMHRASATEMAMCGAEYQEATSQPESQCDCGTDSIGSCRRCGVRVCGYHSRLWDGARLCLEDLMRAAEERNGELVQEYTDRMVSLIEAELAPTLSLIERESDPTARALSAHVARRNKFRTLTDQWPEQRSFPTPYLLTDMPNGISPDRVEALSHKLAAVAIRALSHVVGRDPVIGFGTDLEDPAHWSPDPRGLCEWLARRDEAIISMKITIRPRNPGWFTRGKIGVTEGWMLDRVEHQPGNERTASMRPSGYNRYLLINGGIAHETFDKKGISVLQESTTYMGNTTLGVAEMIAFCGLANVPLEDLLTRDAAAFYAL
jgi:hypothetical protein